MKAPPRACTKACGAEKLSTASHDVICKTGRACGQVHTQGGVVGTSRGTRHAGEFSGVAGLVSAIS
jgi:hypothetical protein